MKNTKKCPLDGSWSQAFCNLYQGLKRESNLHLCQHSVTCNLMRVELEENQNLSTVITKAILLNKIPIALSEIDKTK